MSFPSTAPPEGKVLLFNKNVVSIMVLLGIIVFFVGTMVGTSTLFVKAPSYSDYSDYTAYDNALKNYNYEVHDIAGSANILIEIGGLLACMGLLGGAIENTQIDVPVKCAFISAAIGFVITVLIVQTLINRIGSLY